jgi:glycosyltransferase involved in cell wall biosynthesis
MEAKALDAPRRPDVRPIRILHVITGLDVGGAERMLSRLVGGTDPVRIRHAVVSLLPPGPVAAELAAAGCRVYDLGMSRSAIRPAALLRLARILLRERPDILQTWLYHADLVGTLLGRATRVPAILWNIRCSDMDLGRYPRSTVLAVRLLRHLSRWPTAVITNSAAGRAAHERLGYRPRRWELIPNGFDLSIHHPSEAARLRLRRELKLPPGALLVGMLARLDPMKDHGTFLRAAARLAARHPQVHFVLAGRAVASGALGALAPDEFRSLTGRLHPLGERSDTAAILAALDVATLSSAFGEGCPNALGEAMACGVPCVATSVGDAAALIGPTGLLVPPRDPQALADAWDALLRLPADERGRLGIAARARIAAHFELGAIVERYAAVYEELARTIAPG